jgi:hypothetical protein
MGCVRPTLPRADGECVFLAGSHEGWDMCLSPRGCLEPPYRIPRGERELCLRAAQALVLGQFGQEGSGLLGMCAESRSP